MSVYHHLPDHGRVEREIRWAFVDSPQRNAVLAMSRSYYERILHYLLISEFLPRLRGAGEDEHVRKEVVERLYALGYASKPLSVRASSRSLSSMLAKSAIEPSGFLISGAILAPISPIAASRLFLSICAFFSAAPM